ncbi:MAG: YtxH domain-containing protein [Clostridioides sp.]|jgi:gas vesicle protein|nr:YtxH domain-containing protein [Clostridioides sp.]
MCKKAKKNTGFVLIFGAIIGFVIGIMFAPKKGKELRKDTSKKIDEIKENPKEFFQETCDDVKERFSILMDELEDEYDHIDFSEEDIVITKSFDRDDDDIIDIGKELDSLKTTNFKDIPEN